MNNCEFYNRPRVRIVTLLQDVTLDVCTALSLEVSSIVDIITLNIGNVTGHMGYVYPIVEPHSPWNSIGTLPRSSSVHSLRRLT